MEENKNLLTINNLVVEYHSDEQIIHAVNGVNLSIGYGESLALVGETGAGKSIIIDAVGLLAGGRGSQEFIRRGEEKLRLQGQFALTADSGLAALLDSLGIEYEDGTLIIMREIHRNGRNTIRVNGQLAYRHVARSQHHQGSAQKQQFASPFHQRFLLVTVI